MTDEILLNTKFWVLEVGGDPLACRIDSISSSGDVWITGQANDVQQLLVPFKVFQVRTHDDIIAQLKVLGVQETEVSDLGSISPDDQCIVTVTANLLCDIEKCEFFEV